MKKLFSILLVFALLALGFATAEAGRVTAKGVGQGIDGDVVVQVEADATTIYSVEVLEQNETPLKYTYVEEVSFDSSNLLESVIEGRGY